MKQQSEEKRSRGRPATGTSPQHQFRCPDGEWELFTRAAEAEQLSVAAWIRQVALRAAKRALKAADE